MMTLYGISEVNLQSMREGHMGKNVQQTAQRFVDATQSRIAAEEKFQLIEEGAKQPLVDEAMAKQKIKAAKSVLDEQMKFVEAVAESDMQQDWVPMETIAQPTPNTIASAELENLEKAKKALATVHTGANGLIAITAKKAVAEADLINAQRREQKAEKKLLEAMLQALQAAIEGKQRYWETCGIGGIGLQLTNNATKGCCLAICEDAFSAYNVQQLLRLNKVYCGTRGKKVVLPASSVVKMFDLLESNRFNFLLYVAFALTNRGIIEQDKKTSSGDQVFQQKYAVLQEILEAIQSGLKDNETYPIFLNRIQQLIESNLANDAVNQPTGYTMKLFKAIPVIGPSIPLFTGCRDALIQCREMVEQQLRLRPQNGAPTAAV